jgi:hypothetical protein
VSIRAHGALAPPVGVVLMIVGVSHPREKRITESEQHEKLHLKSVSHTPCECCVGRWKRHCYESQEGNVDRHVFT